jgi:cation diffusion facilitator family transporter
LYPVDIVFDTAILVAVIGLVVNLICAWILKGHENHHHGHAHHENSDSPHHTDYNYRAAFVHVVADALTSVLAIIALLIGKYFGLIWLDPLAGFFGATLILLWAYGLIRQTGRVLLDSNIEAKELDKIRSAMEVGAENQILDLHVWRVSENDFATIVSLVTDTPKPPEYYYSLLSPFDYIKHITVEIHRPDDND